MQIPAFNRANHFSVVWAVTLAVLTIIEWRSLDREPMKEPVMLPFIERTVQVHAGGTPMEGVVIDDFDGRQSTAEEQGLQLDVDIGFNGPLFLLCFFGPVVLFQGIGWLATRARQQ